MWLMRALHTICSGAIREKGEIWAQVTSSPRGHEDKSLVMLQAAAGERAGEW